MLQATCTGLLFVAGRGRPLGAVKLREEGGTIVGRPTSELLPDEIKKMRGRERFGQSGPVMSGGGAKKWT